MELLNQIFAIIFYILFFSWTFLKVRNIVLIKKLNCKEIYKNIKKDLKKQKFPKYSFAIIIIGIILFVIYLAVGLLALALSLVTMFIFNDLLEFVSNYFSLFEYIIYYMYTIVYMILLRSIYINKQCHIQLTSKNDI